MNTDEHRSRGKSGTTATGWWGERLPACLACFLLSVFICVHLWLMFLSPAEDLAGGVEAGGADDAAAGVGGGAAQEQARHRPQGEQLVQRHRPLKDVAAGQAEDALQVRRRQHLAGDD